VASDVTIGFLLQLDRAARMVAQHAVDPRMPGLEDVIDGWSWPVGRADRECYEAAVRRAEERVLVDRLMWLAASSPNGQVRAIASYKLGKLAARVKTAVNKNELDARSANCWRRTSSASRTPARSGAAVSSMRRPMRRRSADRRHAAGLASPAERLGLDWRQ